MRASSTESSTASANTVSICFQRSFVIAGSLTAPHPRDGLVLGLPPQRDHEHISAYKQNTLYTVSTGFFFQAEDGIRDHCVTGVQTCALPISSARSHSFCSRP